MPFFEFIFDLRIRWAESSGFGLRFWGTQNLTAWAIGFSNNILSRRGFCTIGLHKKADSFFRSKNENLKLGIGYEVA